MFLSIIDSVLKFHLVGFVYILWDLLAHKFAFHSKGFSVVIIQKAVGSVTKLSSSKCNLFQPHLEGKSLEAIQGEKRAKKKRRNLCLEMGAINLL